MVRENGKNFKILKIVISMKVNTNLIRKMVTAFLIGKVVIYTKEITRMMKEMGMEKCIGLMDLFIKVNGKEESNMEWEK